MGSSGGFFQDVFDVGANVATGGIYGEMQAANAQGDIAEAQAKQQQSDRALALKFAEATPEELAQLNRAISLNESDIQRKEKLLASADPAIIEAGTQALALLRGEEAKTLAPLRNQFQKQESELRNKLSAQLGSGYETSTAGIQALDALRNSQAATLAQAQENTLGKLLGVAQNVSAAGMGNTISNTATLGQLFGDIQKRKIAALQGSPIDTAGSQFVGDLQRARVGAGIPKKGAELIGTVIGAASGGSLGGAVGGGGAGNVGQIPSANPFA
jgi:hypothetical protein